MLRLVIIFLLLPLSVPAQLIFDFGIGTQAGAIRLSESKDFYGFDDNPYVMLDTLGHFAVKPPDGILFGLRAMTSCTLTSPDNRLFYTATANFNFRFASLRIYRPNFNATTSMHDPPTTWEEPEAWFRYKTMNYSIPVFLNVNYGFQGEGNAAYFGLGCSYNMLRLPNAFDRKAIELWVVAEDRDYPWCTVYQTKYQLSSFWLLEVQSGIIWQNFRGKQNEVFINGNIGKGKLGSVQLGFIRRFNFYRGDR